MSVAAQRRRGFLARLFARDDRVETVIAQARDTVTEEPERPPEPEQPAEPEPAPEPLPDPEPEPEPAAQAKPEQLEASDEQRVLESALDSLGQAHHRPFSRA